MTDPIDKPVKRKAGRPKLSEGEKGSYNVSRRQQARRDTQKKLNARKRSIKKQATKLNNSRTKEKKLKENLKN